MLHSSHVTASAPLAWSDAKTVLERASGISMDAMHVVGGVLLLFGFAILLRRPLSSWLPWTGVLLAVIANEVSDYMVERWPIAAEQFGEAVKDLVWTMFLPTLLVIVARSRPALMVSPTRTKGREERPGRTGLPDEDN